MMRLGLACLAVLAIAALATVAEPSARAKTPIGVETFRLSGGDLPHPVTVAIEEYLLAISGQGTWFDEYGPDVSPPPPEATRYNLEIVLLDSAGAIVGPGMIEEYVVGDRSWMSADDAWAVPIAPVRSLIDRYIALGRVGALPERPTLAESLAASAAAFGSGVSLNGAPLSAGDADAIIQLLGAAQPVVFGVQGTLVGQRILSLVQIEVAFGAARTNVVYVPPGPVAPFGILMPLTAQGSWGITIPELLTPPGYWQTALTVPTDLDEFMAQHGHHGSKQGDIVSNRTVPLLEARPYSNTLERVVLSDGRRTLGELDVRIFEELCLDCETAKLSPPFAGEPLTIEVWNTPMDPFPEAIRPARYQYYPPTDANGRGILVPTQGAAVGNASLGPDLGVASYAPLIVDDAVADAMAAFSQQERRSSSSLERARVPVLVAGALVAIALSIFVFVRSRHRPSHRSGPTSIAS